MKTNLIALAVAATTLTSFAAFADDWDDDDDREGEVNLAVGWNEPPCDHEAAPAPRADGRYELRNSQRWVAERYEQVTVQQCVEKHHGGWKHHFTQQVCYPMTQTRLVPGYYQTVQEWVFVPAPPPPQQYSRFPSQRPPLYGQGRIGIRFGTR